MLLQPQAKLVMIGDFITDAMRARMDQYGQIVKKLATKHNAVFVDTQARFNEALNHQRSSALSWDRVHPNQVGHMILAKAFLDGVKFQWPST